MLKWQSNCAVNNFWLSDNSFMIKYLCSSIVRHKLLDIRTLMKIQDFCKDFDEKLWNKTIDIILSNNDELKNNYLTLSPGDFISWPVLIDNGEIVCFSGLQQNKERWGDKFARVNSRFFINPKYRHNWPGRMENLERFLNTRYLLPMQISTAKELGFQGVFMSREGDHKKVFELYVDLAYRNTGYYFEVLKDRYNVCGCLQPIPESCKQWIAVHCFCSNTQLWHEVMNQHLVKSE